MERGEAERPQRPTSELPRPPQNLRRGAHVAGNGELLWPRSEAVEAVAWMAANHLAIWGGEVYAPRGPFTATMVNEWRTEPGRGRDELWGSYIQRGFDQALAAIKRYPAVRPGVEAERALYFFAYHSLAGFSGELPPCTTMPTQEDADAGRSPEPDHRHAGDRRRHVP